MHNAVVISDSSCVILFTKIDELDILRLVYDHIYVTQEIAREIGNALPEWVEVKEVHNKALQSSFEETLDIGEASALALAFEIPDCAVILDDMKARKSAEKLKIRVTGSIGIILIAKKLGKIPSVKAVFEQIRKTNFRISDRIINEAIKAADESP
ncbi:DUF3368 domain-containing protein [Dyadobacter sp. CY323]|uniref:DUF3368 domain-containing protein n=1 Tax=Dyadobacter sp. CY323 TaxID=2907302 RepID=UPI001F27BE4D|nr:DUF3368 domain-containing protein [Dyadobacter sp. CY323]MCE6989307.1 DUF3368 domain-containing protein [Dyadobacter sp. CY323]